MKMDLMKFEYIMAAKTFLLWVSKWKVLAAEQLKVLVAE